MTEWLGEEGRERKRVREDGRGREREEGRAKGSIPSGMMEKNGE